jgi:ABC-type nitrate/sulfonate/bicarbonate transport system ATPase subunit
MMAGLERPSAGRIEIGGAPPSATLRRAGLSVAFQDPSLLPWRSVRGNIELALASRGARDPAEIDQLIALVGSGRLRRHAPGGAVGRHAPARGHRARACHAPGSSAARRAVRRGG